VRAGGLEGIGSTMTRCLGSGGQPFGIRVSLSTAASASPVRDLCVEVADILETPARDKGFG
jgi:hypothetical protein